MVSHGTPTDPKFTDEPEGIRARSLDTGEDTEGHLRARVIDDAAAADAPEGVRARNLDSDEDDTEGHRIARS